MRRRPPPGEPAAAPRLRNRPRPRSRRRHRRSGRCRVRSAGIRHRSGDARWSSLPPKRERAWPHGYQAAAEVVETLCPASSTSCALPLRPCLRPYSVSDRGSPWANPWPWCLRPVLLMVDLLECCNRLPNPFLLPRIFCPFRRVADTAGTWSVDRNYPVIRSMTLTCPCDAVTAGTRPKAGITLCTVRRR